jgi:hypothetical protein
MSPAPDLADVVADLHRPRVTAAPTSGLRERIDGALRRFALVGLGDRRSDLDVCERSVYKFTQDRLTWALLGSAVGVFVLAMRPLGATSWLTVPTALALLVLGAVGGWLWALIDLRSDAATARREFVASVASYLELVSILMAGGAGVETALFEAAQIGKGRGYRHLRAALSAAQAHRTEPWAKFGELGRRVGVRELEDLEASMTLAGSGAHVRDALAIKAETVRERALAEQEARAHSRSETMVLPVAMMFAGFLLLIGYPALSGLSGP